jgi:hypothetical protein
MTSAAAKRPAMCTALKTAIGAVAAEIAITTSSDSHGAVAGVRQIGRQICHCRDHASAPPQARIAAAMIASVLLID